MEDIPSLPLEVPQDLTNNEEPLYWEVDDVNPNQIIYDLENNQTIIPTSEDEIVVTPEPLEPEKLIISRNVNNTRRRNFR
jgi:hypothetical protein